MKTHLKSCRLLGALLLGLSAGTLYAQWPAVTCGAVSTNVGAQLAFVNVASVSASSGFVYPLIYQRIANRFGTNVFYSATNLFQAISKTNASSAAVGSYIVCEIESVTGPSGGILTYWEQGSGWPTYYFPVGETYESGKNRFIVSNCEGGAGRPDGDPFGSIRGRRLIVNKAGEYTITFRLYDISKNHPTSLDTPIHTPSDPLTIKLGTTVDMGITRFVKTNEVAMLVYKQGLLTNMFVEVSTNILMGWTPVVGPYTNTPTITTNRFTNDPSMAEVFYRLRGVTPE